MFVLMDETALVGCGGPEGPTLPPMAFCGDGDGIDDADLTKLYPYVTADISSIVSSGDEVRSISFLAPDLLSMSSRSELIFLNTCCVTFSKTWNVFFYISCRLLFFETGFEPSNFEPRTTKIWK